MHWQFCNGIQWHRQNDIRLQYFYFNNVWDSYCITYIYMNICVCTIDEINRVNHLKFNFPIGIQFGIHIDVPVLQRVGINEKKKIAVSVQQFILNPIDETWAHHIKKKKKHIGNNLREIQRICSVCVYVGPKKRNMQFTT